MPRAAGNQWLEEELWGLFPRPPGLSVLPAVFSSLSAACASCLPRGGVETSIYSAPSVRQA